jgi:tyrosyl-tRNA synthetase
VQDRVLPSFIDGWCVYVRCPQADVKRKITKAFCPPAVIEKNPCINWARHIVFGKNGRLAVERAEADGGPM